MKTLLTGLVVSVSLAVHAQITASLSVGSSANIFGAGHASPPAPGGGGAGVLPSSIVNSTLGGRVFQVTSVSGSIMLNSSLGGFNNADGNSSFPTDISSWNGISGIHSDASGFLAGVFLGPAEPTDPAPTTLDFTSSGIGTSFLSLSPALGQVFFIGDGLTGNGTGANQQFFAPAGATGLYLGFADASGFMGLPGQYQDNLGSLNVTLRFQSVPEPAAWSLLGLGLGFRLLGRQRGAEPARF